MNNQDLAVIEKPDVFIGDDNVYHALSKITAFFPDKVALVDRGSELTYLQFKRKIDEFSLGLERNKIGVGKKVALIMTNSIEFCIAFYALAKLGAVVIPLSTKFKSEELLYPLVDSGAEVVIIEAQWWKNVKTILAETKVNTLIYTEHITNKKGIIYLSFDSLFESDINNNSQTCDENHILLNMYTSGTTGNPKGAILTHKNILNAAEIYKTSLGITYQDKTIISIPIFHITGLSALLVTFINAGGTIYLTPYFSAKETLKLIHKHKITFVHASPTIYILLLKESQKLQEFQSVRLCAAGSAKMPVEILKTLKQKCPKLDFRSVYGLTETSSPATIMDKDIWESKNYDSCGKPVPGLSIKIVNDNETPCKYMEIGEVYLKGSTVMKGYTKTKKSSNESFQDGWFKTGDLGFLDKEGYLYIVDRKKDMINHGGEKVYSIEVENVIYQHPLVEEVSVIGKNDKTYGEIVVAIIKTKKTEVSEAELLAFSRKKLAAYKVPSKIIFVNEMPHTESGKIDKKRTKEMLLEEIYG
jgi:long-chain acyl-CoA synthetase